MEIIDYLSNFTGNLYSGESARYDRPVVPNEHRSKGQMKHVSPRWTTDRST